MQGEDDDAPLGLMPSGAPVYEAPPISARDRIIAFKRAHPNASAHEIAAALGTKRSTTFATLSRWRHGHYPELPPPPESTEPEFIEVDLRCICRNRQTDTLPGDDPVREVLAKVSCRACGRLGCMSLVSPIEHPHSIDPNDVA